MVRSAVKVHLRTRPTAKFAEGNLKLDPEQQSVSVSVKRREDFGVVNHQKEDFNFKFTGSILHNASQEQVYETVGEEAVSAAIEGYNSTVMAYGQTGAGKTYTMTGGQGSYKQRGLVPRAISEVFRKLHSKPGTVGVVRVSYAEIYNEQFIDLLNPATESSEFSVMEDSSGGVFVKGLSQHLAGSEEEALGLLFEGEANRAIAEHQLNKASSRSHTIFTLSLELRGHGATESMLTSKLHLVDLAGSERLSKTQSTGTVAKEAQHINKSLSFLEQVIMALGDKNREHIPYRSSKLTHMLKDSLGGNCKTIMVANVWAEPSHLDETLSTCNFAKRMMRVVSEAQRNVAEDPAVLVRRLEREIQELKQELSMHDSFSNRSGVKYDAYSEQQRSDLRSQVLQFLESDGGPAGESIDPIELTSLRHVREVLLQCRHLYKAACRPATAGGVHRARPASRQPAAGEGSAAAGAGAAAAYDEAAAVGDLEGDEGYMYTNGVAPDNAAPPGGIEGAHRPTASSTPRGHGAAGSDAAAAAASALPDKAAAYEDYKMGPGAELQKALSENKAALKEKKKVAKDLGLKINAIKHEMDDTKTHQEMLRQEQAAAGGPASPSSTAGAPPGTEVVSEEEYATLLRLKELKRDYRQLYEELKMVKSEVGYTTKLIEQCTSQLLLEFGEWYAATYGPAGGDEISGGGAAGVEEEEDEYEKPVVPPTVLDEGPDSAAYYNAQRTLARTKSNAATARRTGGPKGIMG